ncbi:unnamed protein product, partial [Callosobruchus maculatus]
MLPIWLSDIAFYIQFKSLWNFKFPEAVWSIMSGDSPTSHRNEIFDFREGNGRQSPGPTTSKDAAYPPPNAGVVQASVLVEPDKDKEEEEKALMCSTILNNPSSDGSYNQEQDNTVRADEVG